MASPLNHPVADLGRKPDGAVRRKFGVLTVGDNTFIVLAPCVSWMRYMTAVHFLRDAAAGE